MDEWGTWFTCEPGTNPGFLYQQNTVRDALVAGITLNIAINDAKAILNTENVKQKEVDDAVVSLNNAIEIFNILP